MSDHHIRVDALIQSDIIVVTRALVLMRCKHGSICIQWILPIDARSSNRRSVILRGCQHASVFILSIKTCGVGLNLADAAARLHVVRHVTDHEILWK